MTNMSTKHENINTSLEHVHETTKNKHVDALPFCAVIDRSYDGEGLTLAMHDGISYVFTDGACYYREGDTLDGYTAEFLTLYQLEQRLAAAHQKHVDAQQTRDEALKDAANLFSIAPYILVGKSGVLTALDVEQAIIALIGTPPRGKG